MSGAQKTDFYVAGYCTTPLCRNPKCQILGIQINYLIKTIITPPNFNSSSLKLPWKRNPKLGFSPLPGGKKPIFFRWSERQDVTYTVLATNEFNSARKRMSVLVKKGDRFGLFFFRDWLLGHESGCSKIILVTSTRTTKGSEYPGWWS